MFECVSHVIAEGRCNGQGSFSVFIYFLVYDVLLATLCESENQKKKFHDEGMVHSLKLERKHEFMY